MPGLQNNYPKPGWSGHSRERRRLANLVEQTVIEALQQAYPSFEIGCIQILQQALSAPPHDSRDIQSHVPVRLLRADRRTFKAHFSPVKDRFIGILRDKFAALYGEFEHCDFTSEDHFIGDSQGRRRYELASKEEFWEWDKVMDAAKAVERRLNFTRSHIKEAVNAFYGSNIPENENPLLAETIIWAFKTAVAEVGLGAQVRGLLYPSVGESLLAGYPATFDRVMAILDGTVPQDGQSFAHGTPSSGLDGRSFKTERPHDRQLFDRLTAVLSFHTSASTDEGAEPKDGRHVRPEELGAILEDLRVLELGIQRRQRVTDAIAGALPTGKDAGLPYIPAATSGIIDTAETLIDELKSDPSVMPELAHIIGDLKLPLIKESIVDPAFLEAQDHPAQRLLQGISELAPYLSMGHRSPAERREIDAALGRIRDHIRIEGAVDLGRLSDMIDELLADRQVAFERNTRIVVNTVIEEEANRAAEKQVMAHLFARLVDHSIPSVVLRLLRYGWLSLLIRRRRAFAEGNDVRGWLKERALLDHVIDWFRPDAQLEPVLDEERRRVLDTLAAGFEAYPVHAEKGRRVVELMRQALSGDRELYRGLVDDRMDVTARSLQRLLEGRLPLPLEATADPDARVMERLPALERGDWIVERVTDQVARLLNLVWVGSNRNRFVFVDCTGDKALDVSGADLVDLVERGRCSLLEDTGMPLFERTAERLLRRGFEARLEAARTDPLTGLLNRKAFESELSHLLRTGAERFGHALIVLDLDDFASFNENCSVAGGDRMLSAIAKLLGTYGTSGVSVARLEEDSFALLARRSSLDRAYHIAESVRNVLANFQYPCGDEASSVTASVGLILVETPLVEPADLIDAASAACSLAKDNGKNCTRFVQRGADTNGPTHALNAASIDAQLAADNLALWVQRVVPLKKGAGTAHYDVMLRLHDRGSAIAPDAFIAAALQAGVIDKVEQWLIDTLLTTLDEHPHVADGDLAFSVNLSSRSVCNPRFMNYFKGRLERLSFPTSRLIIEILDTDLAAEWERIQPFLDAIGRLGCRCHLDDCGSGDSTYACMRLAAIDAVKIGGLFVGDMAQDESSLAVVKSITEVAHHYSKQVIANQASREDLERLRRLDVDYAQGDRLEPAFPLSELVEI